ncbi:hypothetical protein [Micromonospora sp. NPDC049497]|uniref:hypothetical protein n=1 Tax=Micromonospora sp. NPDC049497 TaxID=3364273 RepID=UPI00379F9550
MFHRSFLTGLRWDYASKAEAYRADECDRSYHESGTPATWCTVDEFYGGDRGLRRNLQARGMGYVLAVARSHRTTTSPALGPQRANHVAAVLSSRAWNRYSAGDRTKEAHGSTTGHRWRSRHLPTNRPRHHCLLIRRRLPAVNWPSTAAGHPDP